jgi:hypothetical protein
MDIKKNRLAQDIDIDNNPVNKDNDIIPEDKDIKETTPTPVITEEEIKPIEEMNTITMIEDPNIPPVPGEDNVVDAKRPKNTVRYIDSGFTF